MTRNEIVELLPLYALGSLDVEQMLAVDAFLQNDETLLAQVAELEDAVAQLAYSAPPVPAPKDSLARLMGKIDVETAQAKKSKVVTKSAALPQPSWLERLLGHFNGWTWATAGFAALCLLLSLYALQLRNENGRLIDQVQLLQNELKDDSVLVADLYQADRIISLPGTEEAAEASGIFYTQENAGFFIINGLEPLPAEQTYQLWLVPPGGDAGDAVSVGFLPVGESDPATQTVTIPGDLLDFYIVDVSVEPAGGSENLSGPVVIRGTE